MSDFCLSCCKQRHTELKGVSEKRFVTSKYTSICSGCGQIKKITLGIRPKKRTILSTNVIARHLL